MGTVLRVLPSRTMNITVTIRATRARVACRPSLVIAGRPPPLPPRPHPQHDREDRGAALAVERDGLLGDIGGLGDGGRGGAGARGWGAF